MKLNVKCFGYNNLLRDFKFMKSVVKIVMVLKKVITTETFNVDFHNKFIIFGLFCFFSAFLHNTNGIQENHYNFTYNNYRKSLRYLFSYYQN